MTVAKVSWRGVLPGIALGLAACVALGTGVDLEIADRVYQAQGEAWTLRHHFVVSKLLHARAQKLAIAVYAAVALLALVSLRWRGLQAWRASLSYLAAASLGGIVLVAAAKQMLPIPCPSQLARYGGGLAAHLWQARSQVAFGHGCFPAAHATGGFALAGWYFVARARGWPRPWLWAMPALGVGSIFGAAQQLRGAHFLSHDLAAAAVCWTVAWALARRMAVR